MLNAIISYNLIANGFVFMILLTWKLLVIISVLDVLRITSTLICIPKTVHPVTIFAINY